MKVWECNKCSCSGSHEPCILFDPIGELEPTECPSTTGNLKPKWEETTRYEITERKPDYLRMVQNRQFGKFGNKDGTMHNYGHLTDYFESMACPFWGLAGSYETFTPCAEPVELDPITMKEKNK